MIERGGHRFEGYDKPIRTPNHSSGKSHAVVVKVDGKPKLIRFGAQGANTKPEKVSPLQTRQSGHLSKPGTPRTSQKARPAPRTGLTK